MKKSVGPHRHRNYWDVIYDKKINLDGFEFWDLHDLNVRGQNNSGPKKIVLDLSIPSDEETCSGDESESGGKTREKEKTFFSDYVFIECDITGKNQGTRITFESCQFRKVFFGYCHLVNIKFKNCKFVDCSFAMSYFEECQFNDCEYENIFFSSNESKFINTYVDAEKFIRAGFVNTDIEVCKENKTTPEYQIYRAKKTKAKFSKTLINSLSSHPDDEPYYKSIKVHSNCKIESKKSTLRSKIKSKPFYKKPLFFTLLMLTMIEEYIIKTSGLVNNWGGGLFRCVMVGLFIIIIFAFIYLKFNELSIGLAVMKSLEITLIAGYTKYSNTGTPFYQSIIQLINMIIGLWWYAILIPTLLNKVCASRS